MRFKHFLLGIGAFLIPQTAFLQSPYLAQVAINGCGFAPGLPCATGGVAGGLSVIFGTIIPGMQYVFYAIALIFLFYYGIRLMLESEDENTITETKSAYGHAIAGAVCVSLMDNIIAAVSPGYASNTLINPLPVQEGLGIVIFYIRLMIASAVSGMVVYLGFRMIVLQGQEAEMEQQKKRFFYGLIGVAIVQLSFVVINSFLPGAGSNALAVEIVGIINFLLQILAALAVLGFIVAGIMLIVSTDEALKDRAKKAIFTTVISLVIVLVCYIVIKFTINVTSVSTGTDITMIDALI